MGREVTVTESGMACVRVETQRLIIADTADKYTTRITSDIQHIYEYFLGKNSLALKYETICKRYT